MKFDNEAEEDFYDFLVNFELTSMIKNIESQINVKYGNSIRRVDFVITLTNNRVIFLEIVCRRSRIHEYALLFTCTKNYYRFRFGRIIKTYTR